MSDPKVGDLVQAKLGSMQLWSTGSGFESRYAWSDFFVIVWTGLNSARVVDTKGIVWNIVLSNLERL